MGCLMFLVGLFWWGCFGGVVVVMAVMPDA